MVIWFFNINFQKNYSNNYVIVFAIFPEQLKAVCKEYYQRIQKIESEKWDLEQSTAANDMKVNLLVLNFFVKYSLHIHICIFNFFKGWRDQYCS